MNHSQISEIQYDAILLEAIPFDAMIQGVADGFTALSLIITLTAGESQRLELLQLAR